jgi:ABC-2 type transport system ATP-binding protein
VLSVLGYDPVTQAEQLRPLVGSQLQDSALPDRLRVSEALALFATSRARDGGELLERFGLAGRRRSVFSSLSGGERQRLFLVLALLNSPRLVILDERPDSRDGYGPGARRRDTGGAGGPACPQGDTVRRSGGGAPQMR